MPSQFAITPSSVPAGAARPYSLAVRHGNTLYVSGQVGQDFATGAPASEEFAAQVRQTLENLRTVLAAGGSSLDRVLSTTCYVTEIADWARMNEIYVQYFTSDPKPARATVQAGLVPPYKFEISAIAYIEE